MLKIIFLTLIMIHSVFGNELSFDERRLKILNIVNEELGEIRRLSKQQDHKIPSTLFRLSELYLEKARLYRELENEQYLSIPVKKRVTVNKSDYFKRSIKYFKAANKAAHRVAKRFPRYTNIGDVYYILGYNYKEIGESQIAHKYFQLASISSKDQKIKLMSKQALADDFYNNKSYRKAIPFYSYVIKNSDDKWWTKNAFNLAWCYYQEKKYTNAIKLMRLVHKKSGGKFADYRSLVERDIGVFYVEANKLKEAISFYESLGMSYTHQFVKIANGLALKGKYSQANKLLKELKIVEKDEKRKVEVLLAQQDLYDKFSKIQNHLAATRELVYLYEKNLLSGDQYNRLLFQANKLAAKIQKDVISKKYRNLPKKRKSRAKQAVAFFELCERLEKDKKSEKVFYQAETSYAVGLYLTGLKLYISAFDVAKKENDKKIQKESLEGMLACLDQDKISTQKAEKFYISVYSRYLTFDSLSKRASSIFIKLFNTQYDLGRIEDAEKTFKLFSMNFQNDLEKQEAMLAKIMEFYRKRKNYTKIKSYVGSIKQGEFKVSPKYLSALKSLMTKIQIEDVQLALKKGDKASALNGYLDIFHSPESTSDAKINAAYNLAALYFELASDEASLDWALVALKGMKGSDVEKLSESLLNMASGFFLRQNFSGATDLSYAIFKKLCNQRTNNKTISFKNAVYIALSNEDLAKAIETKNLAKACKLSNELISEASFEILNMQGELNLWESYEKTLRELEEDANNFPHLIFPLEKLRLRYLEINDSRMTQLISDKQMRFYKFAKKRKLRVPVNALNVIALRELDLVRSLNLRMAKVELSFPEASFNQSVKDKLTTLDKMTSAVKFIQSIGSGLGIVESYKFLIESYESFGISLKNFTPPDKSPEYIKSFKKAMVDTYRPILEQAQKLRQEIKNLILENKILSDSNFYVLFNQDTKHKRYIGDSKIVIMDRDGKR